MDSNNDPTGNSFGGFAFGVGLSLGVLFLIVVLALVSYFCSHTSSSSSSSASHAGEAYMRRHGSSINSISDRDSIAIEVGLDGASLGRCPKLLYSQVKFVKTDSSLASCCSICLGDYNETDMLRFLPNCGHVFHLKCVDSWLRLHPSCPICRDSPLPTPLSTPLAEVAPLAHSSHQ